MKKECNVVMLATDKNSGIGGIYKRISDNGLWMDDDDFIGKLCINQNSLVTKSNVSFEAQHLYFTSDEKIKEGDWYLFFLGGDTELEIMQCRDKDEADRCNNHPQIYHSCSKIIATTDTSLLELTDREIDGFSGHIPLPQIPQSFIDIFIEQYNKGNVIDKVLVEYTDRILICPKCNSLLSQTNDQYCDVCRQYSGMGKLIKENLRINPDNTINISLIEEEKKYSRSEVEELLHKCWVQATKKTLDRLKESGFKTFIDDHLK